MAKKILIILSDAHAFPLKKSDGTIVDEETGFFLMELAKPLSKLLDAGYEVTVSLAAYIVFYQLNIDNRLQFASPEGKQPNVDPLSTSTPMAFLGNWWEKKKESELIEQMKLENNLKSPRPFRTITDAELAGFDGVFVPGGHAPLTDLGDNPELGRILLHFHEKSKPTGM
jgi:putative intracellular protease/amidase